MELFESDKGETIMVFAGRCESKWKQKKQPFKVRFNNFEHTVNSDYTAESQTIYNLFKYYSMNK